MNKVFRIIFFVITAGGLTFAQFTQFHPELTWYTIKGKHVQVHYHEGAERTAKVVAKIGDEVWDPITSLYNYEPDVVHYVIKDIDDYSNGATYFFDNKIEIWSSALDFDLRGTHNWLRNVISHEFTHMVQIQASLKTTRTIPAVYLQWLNYEDERRPDILYGFPNIIMSYPIAFINMPSWFAEGTAQYMRKDFNYDNWDSHRDMILRSYVLDGNMLTWNQMGVFDKTSLGNESVYNSGFALTRYLSQQYGEDKLRLITNALGKWKNYTIDAAFKDVLGKDGNEIYGEWKAYLTKNYNDRIKDVKANFVAGDTLAQIGFGNFYPSFSEDGKKFIYISNKMGDYMGLSSVFEYDIETKKEEIITEGVRSTVSYVPGQKKIIFAKLTDKNPNFYNVHDLYVYDIEKKEETRLTNGLRANQPSVSPDGKKIVFLFQTDGTTNVGLVDIDGKNFKQLTVFHNGEQTYNPKFSPDSRYVIFDYSNEGSRDIAKVNVDATGFAFVIKTASDERNPVFDKEGNLIYSSDETGIYNLYKYNFSKAEKTRLTNVTGGAFMPAVNKNGDILYAGYTSTGYKIFYLKNEVSKKVVDTLKYTRMNNPPLGEDKPKGDMAKFDLERLKHFDDTQLPDYKPEKYSGAFSKVSIFPFIRYDNYSTSSNALDKIKPGVYLSSSDMLNRYGFFAGASINKRMERDLFLIFDYRNKIPLLYNIGIKPELSVELYNVSRKANTDVAFGADTVSNVVKYDYSTKTDVTYNLMECDFVIKHMLFARDNMLELRFIYSRYNAMLGSFILPDETLYPASDDVYLIGRNLQLKYSIRNILPAVDEEINPIGYTLDLTYNYEFNKFNKDSEYEVEDGILKPIYKNYDFHRLEVNSAIHMPTFKNHTLSARIRMGTIFGPDVPDFFDFYLGGMAGMKAYPFYAISGNEIGWLNVTYRFPLFRNIDARLGHLYLDKIFFSVYGDLGNAWYGNMPSLSDFKKGAGAELRIGMTSFYMFPTNIFFNASYGFDKFERVVRDKTLSYGKEWRLYAGVLFGFDF